MLLTGHTDTVNAVRFCTSPTGERLILSASSDKTIRGWRGLSSAGQLKFLHAVTLEGHSASINTIAVCEQAGIFATGAADGTAKIWRLSEEEHGMKGKLLETIMIKPLLYPLTLSLRAIPSENGKQAVLLVIGGTRNTIQAYVSQDVSDHPEFTFFASLTGHEGWVRSLAFMPSDNNQEFILASASQDKYIRLWKINAGEPNTRKKNVDQELVGTIEKTLTNKTYSFHVNNIKYSMSFEALLFGHEDWIYTIDWNNDPNKPQLLSASADNSLVVWEPDPISGVWFSAARMGEISAQKGSTTATGSAGGFWIGLWSPESNSVACLGRTGSWRRWRYIPDMDSWVQIVGISGHVKSVNGIGWDPYGEYLLSVSSDQTTRLHAEWRRDGKASWHEFSRPQIHGYDLNCIVPLGASRFVSGADEKLLRVFDEPKVVAHLLEKLCGSSKYKEDMPEAANIPVLGLSNKAIEKDADIEEEEDGTTNTARTPAFDLDYPPFEDHLAKYTLWPELEKLYGHGYEISAATASHDDTLLATACKASSIDHAVIRLYDITTWCEIRPPLTAHSLTITNLRFSSDDRFLLSVGRDRQWALFERNETDRFRFCFFLSNPKGHSRMILASAWAPQRDNSKRIFATAGRDKNIKIWIVDVNEKTAVCSNTILCAHPVTAIDFFPLSGDFLRLAIGDDTGQIGIYSIEYETMTTQREPLLVPESLCPSKSITQLTWRPITGSRDTGSNSHSFDLAVASEDSATRIYVVSDFVWS